MTVDKPSGLQFFRLVPSRTMTTAEWLPPGAGGGTFRVCSGGGTFSVHFSNFGEHKANSGRLILNVNS